MHPSLRYIARLAPVAAVAVAGGFAAASVGIPLPWTIGSLGAVAAWSLIGITPPIPKPTRAAGQIVVASAIGLSFSAAAFASLVDHFAAMVLMAAIISLTGLAVALVLSRAVGLDATTACLICIPAGPVETANLAQRYGIPAGPVIFSQTLRITCVVVFVPLVVIAIEGMDPAAVTGRAASGLSVANLLLLAGCVAGAFLFRCLRVPNPWFLGAIAVSAGVAAAGAEVERFPAYMLAGGQVLLGISLGAAFDRAVLRNASRLLPAILVTTAVFLLLCLGFGLALAQLFGLPPQTMVLSAAPGSITEMALTAVLVHADAPMVIAFNIVRIFLVIPSAPLLVSLVRWAARRRRTSTD